MNARHRVEIIAVLWLVVAGVFTAALATDWTRVWHALGIPAMSPAFADLRTITGGLRSTAPGADPLRDDPGDPWARTMNYPRLWLHLFRMFGIDDANVPVVGLLFAAAYLASISLLIWRARDGLLAVAIGACALSGASLLAMERGNNDLVILALVLVAVVSRSLTASAMAMASAVVLKLYPVVAIAQLATASDRRRRALAALLLAFSLVVVAVTFRDVLLIGAGTPRSFRGSYGVLSLLAGCGALASRFPLISARCADWSLRLAALALLAGLALLTARLAWRSRWGWTPEQAVDTSADLFVAFAAVYASTYFTGSHWDYRLIFLVPTLPFLVALARRESTRWLGWASVLLVGLVMNATRVGAGPWTYFGHLAKACLAFVCLFLLVTLCRARLVAAHARA